MSFKVDHLAFYFCQQKFWFSSSEMIFFFTKQTGLKLFFNSNQKNIALLGLKGFCSLPTHIACPVLMRANFSKLQYIVYKSTPVQVLQNASYLVMGQYKLAAGPRFSQCTSKNVGKIDFFAWVTTLFIFNGIGKRKVGACFGNFNDKT